MGLMDIVGGALGAQGPGGDGGQAELMSLVMSLLAGDGSGNGGLAALVARMQSAGLGEQVNSWVSTGPNLPVSPEQMQGVFGEDQMAQVAQRMGLSTGDLGAQLSRWLPQVVDQATPQGRLPDGGLGDLGDLLGGLLRR